MLFSMVMRCGRKWAVKRRRGLGVVRRNALIAELDQIHPFRPNKLAVNSHFSMRGDMEIGVLRTSDIQFRKSRSNTQSFENCGLNQGWITCPYLWLLSRQEQKMLTMPLFSAGNSFIHSIPRPMSKMPFVGV